MRILQNIKFSCRAADWTKMSFSHVPMQFEPLELHVVTLWGNRMCQTISSSQPKLLPRMSVKASCVAIMRPRGHIGFEIGSQDLVDTPRCTNTRFGGPSECFLSRMWFVPGQQLPMHAFALLYCQRCLLRNHGQDLPMNETHLVVFLLDLQEYPDCKMDSSYYTLSILLQRRHAGAVPSSISYIRCRKPQSFTYHACAEDITKTVIIPYLSGEDRQALEEEGVIPPESSARDRFCVMCPVKRGSPRLLPCCLRNNWCHIGCSYQTHWAEYVHVMFESLIQRGR